MARLTQIYYNAVFGALGGLLGWMLFGIFTPSGTTFDWHAALSGGAIIGLMIGYFVVSVDAIVDRALVRFARYAAYGILLGAAGGAVGYLVGDWVNYVLTPEVGEARLLGRVMARAFGWTLFGLLVGVSEGVASRSLSKVTYGAIGGSLGGFIGGAIFGWLMEALDKQDSSYTIGQAIGLVVLGACIGALTALVQEVLKPAAIKVLRGWQEGREYPIVKNVNVLGRDEAADVLLLRDMTVEKRHAEIQRQGNKFIFVNRNAPPEHTKVNDAPVEKLCELQDGDRIQLGQIILRFLLRSAQKKTLPKRPLPTPGIATKG
jgi:MFS family permease